MAAYTEDQGFKLALRNTFIEMACSTDPGEDLSPRASSEPRSETSRESVWFESETVYVSQFQEKMNSIWGEKAWSDRDSWSDSASYARNKCSASACSSDDISSLSAVTSCLPEVVRQPRTSAVNHPKTFRKDKGINKEGQKSMNKEGLRYQLKTAEWSMTYSQRVSTALAAIDELPEQLEDVLKQTVNCVYDDVQGEIDAIAQNVIRTEAGKDSAGQAVESLEVIPDMVLHSFKASFAKATDSVRRRVQVVIQDVEEGELRTDQIVTQLRTIPEDVQTLTEQAVEEAVQEVKMQAHKQLDVALQAIPESNTAATNTLSDQTLKLVTSVPSMIPDTVNVAKECMAVSVEQAVADVQGEEIPKGPKGTGNQVVSDALLRAKADDHELQENTQDLETLRLGPIVTTDRDGTAVVKSSNATNPGSVGHPELCPRPCLYFTMGQCNNGMLCDFCHLPHPKRPAHLDKRHRNMLKGLPFKECVHMILVILKEKLSRLEFNSKANELLSLLETSANKRSALAPTLCESRSAKERSMLHNALRALSVRSLLTTLHRMAQPEGCPEQCVIDELLRCLRFQCHDSSNDSIAFLSD